jgi:hypothetical protein
VYIDVGAAVTRHAQLVNDLPAVFGGDGTVKALLFREADLIVFGLFARTDGDPRESAQGGVGMAWGIHYLSDLYYRSILSQTIL